MTTDPTEPLEPDELGEDGAQASASDLANIQFEDGISVLDKLKRRRDEREEEKSTRQFVEAAVPGWDNLIKARFRYVPVKELRARTRKAARAARTAGMNQKTSDTVLLAIETINIACVEVLANTPRGLQPFDSNANPPIAFDSRLLSIIGLPAGRGTYHEVILTMFGSEYAILNTASELTKWFEDRSYAIDEEILGE